MLLVISGTAIYLLRLRPPLRGLFISNAILIAAIVTIGANIIPSITFILYLSNVYFSLKSIIALPILTVGNLYE